MALALPPLSGSSIVLQRYDGTTVPTNKEGITYPTWTWGRGDEGGTFTPTLDAVTAVSGKSLRLHLLAAGGGNMLYAAFNPYDGFGREFARTYAENPSSWQFNTYTRLTFWILCPAQLTHPYETNGRGNANIGAYAKRCVNPNYTSDEDGGGHFYYNQNWPLTGTWVQCIVNAYVDHWRGSSGNVEEGSALHITGEANYNLFDAWTRFYLQTLDAPSVVPTDYWIDEIRFYREAFPEPEQQVRDIAATHLPASNRIIVTWCRNKNEDTNVHEVRYGFSDLHQAGWASARPAPDGMRTPPGEGGYNSMFYDTTALPLSGHAFLYLGIRPLANNPQGLFAQVMMPLGVTAPPTDPIPASPTHVRVIP